jgi:mRNA-degrading endonuclease toxin of MazEF toxin-antitoxin module
VSTAPYVPDRGDVVWLSFNPQARHEQAGRRPALVLSPASYNGRVGLALLCPVTNQAKGYPFEVPLPADDLTDALLLGRFLVDRDEAAFHLLLARYGPMVLGVCRRVLGDGLDAEADRVDRPERR